MTPCKIQFNKIQKETECFLSVTLLRTLDRTDTFYITLKTGCKIYENIILFSSSFNFMHEHVAGSYSSRDHNYHSIIWVLIAQPKP